MKMFFKTVYKPCYYIADDNGFIGVLSHRPSRSELLLVSRYIGIPLERVRVKLYGCIAIPNHILLPF